MGAGGVLCVVAWFISAGTRHESDQGAPLILALVALIVSGIGHGLWLLRGRRSVGQRQREILRAPMMAARQERPLASSVGHHLDDVAVLADQDGKYFHRSDCAFVAGRSVQHIAAAAASNKGLTACGVCRP